MSSSADAALAYRAAQAIATQDQSAEADGDRSRRSKPRPPRPSMATKASMAQTAADQVTRMATEPDAEPAKRSISGIDDLVGATMREVAREVNAGALDSGGIRVTASVAGQRDDETADRTDPEDVVASEEPAGDRQSDRGGRKLVPGGHRTGALPDDIFKVPTGLEFELAAESYGLKFLPADELERIGYALIAEMPELRHLDEMDIVFRWKASGGAVDEVANYGDCQKLSGPVQHFARAEFMVWLAADHCRAAYATHHQVEALVYHQLSHCQVDDKAKPSRVGHDYSGFVSEVHRYGTYRDSLRIAANRFSQVSIWDYRGTLNERGALDLTSDQAGS